MARWVLVLVIAGCTTQQERRDACFSGFAHDTSFGDEIELTITGNPGSAMEPRLSPDERFLFFNDKPGSDDAMQLHVAPLLPSSRAIVFVKPISPAFAAA